MTQINQSVSKYTAADALMEAIRDAGVSYIFSNLGSDHPAIIESWAKAKLNNIEMPEIIVCPHEFVALSAAHGYAQITGKTQVVLVHVDVGTQNLGGSVGNAFRGRAPVLIIAGTSPYSMENELLGGRNEHIHFLQDNTDQRSFVRETTKWNYELRTGENVRQVLYRALQIAESEPKGPVYLMAAREMLEEEVKHKTDYGREKWGSISPSGLPPEDAEQLAKALQRAKQPLIMTSYLGRNEQAIAELTKLSDRLAIPVVEVGQTHVNFPSNHPMHMGYRRHQFISESDLILVIDSDVPWIPSQAKPSEECEVYYLDSDPLKETIPLWYIPSERFYRVDSFTALKQLNTNLDQSDEVDRRLIDDRYAKFSRIHDEQRQQWKKKLEASTGEYITPEMVAAALRELIDEKETIILNETVSNMPTVWEQIQPTVPGVIIHHGASSLGWGGGAALGVKLADPDKTVVYLCGDGTFMFSVPTSVYWMSRKYNAPIFTVIFNNRGWKSPKLSTLGVHPEGIAKQNDLFWVNFDPIADLDKVAEAAGGAYAQRVTEPKDLKEALEAGLKAVKEGRSAVIDVHLQPASKY